MPMNNTAQYNPTENSTRLFQCCRCFKLVSICSYCDRGNIYCSKSCSVPARKYSRCSASSRYQLTTYGKQNHALCQKRYRAKLQSKKQIATECVIDQGSPANPLELCSPTVNAVDEVVVSATQVIHQPCDFCGRCGNGLHRYHFIKRYHRVTSTAAMTSAGFPLGP